jgi:adenylate kinase family enzyme
MLHTVIFIGRSGCGKGTQAGLLKNRITDLDSLKRQIIYVETGAMFREFNRGKGFSSKLSKEIDEKDDRQPDFLACSMWGNLLIEKLGEDMHLVFDGVARSLPEATIISTAMKFYKREKPIVIYINVSRKWSEERLLSRGRSDDRSLSGITKRLNWFEEDTLPAIEYFRTNSLYRFIEVDGEQPIEKVYADIITAYDH